MNEYIAKMGKPLPNAKPSGKTAQGQDPPKPRAGEHTKEPWKIEQHPEEVGIGLWAPSWGFIGFLNSGSPDEANARRIVACVNACEGVSLDALETVVTGGLVKSLLSERDALAAQNTELVEALKGLLAAWDAEAANGSLYPADVHKAHALLARLKP